MTMRNARSLAGLAGLLALTAPSFAWANSALDSPDNGALQLGRGSAWLARADDPLAVYYNPAALSRQATGVHLGAHFIFLDRCFSRLREDGKPVSPGDSEVFFPGPGAPGGPEAEVCADAALIPNPQLAATVRITDDLAVGLAVVTPHGVGKLSWPESVELAEGNGPSQPAPNRYLLTEADSLLLFPTLSVSYAVTRDISIGAGFVWGLATVDFTNFSESTSGAIPSDVPPNDNFARNGAGDIKANLKGKDLFIPGFVIGALWSATPSFDVAGWFRWSDAVDGSADLYLQSNYWAPNGTKKEGTGGGDDKANITDVKDAGRIGLKIPMEAKLGVDYHHARTGGPKPKWADTARRVRDPLSEDLFDVELDLTWAHNSAVDAVELRFLGDPDIGGQQIHVNGTPGNVPTNGDVPHEWKDVLGVRLGGDYVVLPNTLALRAGGFFETKGQDDEYLNLDFHVGSKVGLGGGATVRIGPIDVSVAYQHTFFGDIDNGGKGCVAGLSGDASPEQKDSSNTCGKNSDGTRTYGPFRTRQAVNGGKLTSSMNEVALGGTLRF